MVREWIREAGYGMRALVRTPGISIVVVLTLSLGIGSSIAVFSLIEGILIDPLPLRVPQRLLEVYSSAPGISNAPPRFGVSFRLYDRYSREADAIAGAGLYSSTGSTLRTDDRAERVTLSETTLSLFTTLGVVPWLGALPAEADLAGESSPILISHGLWTSVFGSDPDIVGKVVFAADSSRTIVGVMGPEFAFPGDRTALWLPFAVDSSRLNDPEIDFRWGMVARLKPNATAQQLVAQLKPIASRIQDLYAENPQVFEFLNKAQLRVGARPLHETVVGDVSRPLWILLGTVLAVWMIACANVANLFFVRAESRQREIAVRSALGAGRGRLVRVFFTECAILALAGGLSGGGLGWLLVSMLVGAAPPGTPRLDNVGIDLRVVTFAVVITIASAFLFGLVPALRYSSSRVLGNLNVSGVRTTDGRHRNWIRGGLVIAQSGMAMVLLIGSALLLQSFVHLLNVNPGYDSEDVLTFQVAPPPEVYPTSTSVWDFHRRMMERLASLPGVESVGAVLHLPIDEEMDHGLYEFEGEPGSSGEALPLIMTNYAAPGYFQSMRIPILEGRGFSAADNQDQLGQVVVSRSVAGKHWPNQGAIGKRLRLSGEASEWQTVVGVVGEVRGGSLREEPEPVVYLPFVGPKRDEGWSTYSPAYTIRARNAESLAPVVREEARRMEALMPVYRMQTMEQVLRHSVVLLTFILMALGISAVLALILGTVGLYGVLSYVVSQRKREMGIRLALGARVQQVRRMVVLQGTRLALVGIVGGLLGAAAITQLLRDLLYGTGPLDPLIFGATAAVMLLVSALACIVPARRACSVDPVESMRTE